MSACIVCGSDRASRLFRASDRLYHTTTKKFEVVRCGDCGLLRLHPQPPAEELRLYYPSNYWFSPGGNAASRLEEAYRRLVLRDHIRFTRQALRPMHSKRPLLDTGSGGGLFLRMMREHGFPAVGLDFSPEAAGAAWRHQNAPSVCSTLDCAPFAPGAFSAITMFHVLEHLPDPRVYLRAAHRLLENDGRLIVQVPNRASWQFRLLGRAWNGVDVPRHLFDFRSLDLEKLLECAGFEVVRRKYFSLRDNPAGLATSIAPFLDPMARRVRGAAESGAVRLSKDLLYFALVLGALPFAAAEAACRAGSTIMIEARKR